MYRFYEWAWENPIQGRCPRPLKSSVQHPVAHERYKRRQCTRPLSHNFLFKLSSRNFAWVTIFSPLQVGMLKDVYFFTHRAVPRRQRRSTLVRNIVLQSDRRVCPQSDPYINQNISIWRECCSLSSANLSEDKELLQNSYIMTADIRFYCMTFQLDQLRSAMLSENQLILDFIAQFSELGDQTEDSLCDYPCMCSRWNSSGKFSSFLNFRRRIYLNNFLILSTFLALGVVFMKE